MTLRAARNGGVRSGATLVALLAVLLPAAASAGPGPFARLRHRTANVRPHLARKLEGVARLKLPLGYDRVLQGPGVPTGSRDRPQGPTDEWRSYRFVFGEFSDWRLLGGWDETTPVVLDVLLFHPDAGEEDVESLRSCRNTDLWGSGCGAGDGDDSMGGGPRGRGRRVLDAAVLVREDGARRLYRRERLPPYWSDDEHRAAVGVSFVDRERKVRLDLYAAFGVYSASRAEELLWAIGRSLEVDAPALRRLMDATAAERREREARLQAELAAVREAVAPLGVTLERPGYYQHTKGVILNVDLQGDEVRTVTLAVPLGAVRVPAGHSFTRQSPPRLRLTGSFRAEPLPGLAHAGGETSADRGFAIAFWDGERGEWWSSGLHLADSAGKYREQGAKLGLSEDLTRAWPARDVVHVYRQLSFSPSADSSTGDARRLGEVLGAFVRAARAMQQELAAGRLVTYDG